MRAPFRMSPAQYDPEDFGPPQAPDVLVYPTERVDEPELYDHDGRPLYRRRQPFGFCRPTPDAP